jgi:hypothetical protein
MYSRRPDTPTHIKQQIMRSALEEQVRGGIKERGERREEGEERGERLERS